MTMMVNWVMMIMMTLLISVSLLLCTRRSYQTVVALLLSSTSSSSSTGGACSSHKAEDDDGECRPKHTRVSFKRTLVFCRISFRWNVRSKFVGIVSFGLGICVNCCWNVLKTPLRDNYCNTTTTTTSFQRVPNTISVTPTDWAAVPRSRRILGTIPVRATPTPVSMTEDWMDGFMVDEWMERWKRWSSVC